MKGYSFGELVKLAEAAMPRAGGTFTGDITAPKVFLNAPQDMAASAAVRLDYLNSRVSAAGYKTVTVNGPVGAEVGKCYPVVLNRATNGVDVKIWTRSAQDPDPTNQNWFNGFVQNGGWGDPGRVATGTLHRHDNTEKAIISVFCSTQDGRSVAFYVDGGAFPVNVRTEGNVDVVGATTHDTPITIEGSTYPVGLVYTNANDIVAAGDKIRLLLEFADGTGEYSTLSVNSAANFSTRSGSITGAAVYQSGPQSSAANSLTRKDYVDSGLGKKANAAGQIFTGAVLVDRGADAEPTLGVVRNGRQLALFDNATYQGIISQGMGNGITWAPLLQRETATGNILIGDTTRNHRLNMFGSTVRPTYNGHEVYHEGAKPTGEDVGTRYRFNASNQSYIRLGRIADSDNSAVMILAGGGDFGGRTRDVITLTLASRGGYVEVRASKPHRPNQYGSHHNLFTRKVGNAFEFWVQTTAYNHEQAYTLLSATGWTDLRDSVTSTAPSDLVQHPVYINYDTGNRPTASEVGALPITGGTLTGSLTVNDASLYVRAKAAETTHLWFHNSDLSERAVIYAGANKKLTLRAAGGTGVTIDAGSNLATPGSVTGSRLVVNSDASAGSAGVISAVIRGGAYANWKDRETALGVGCPASADEAYSVWKATHWGRGHVAAMDVHWPNNQSPQVVLHVAGQDNAHYWTSQDYTANGAIRAGNGIWDRGHLVYSPLNIPNLQASQSCSDILAGGWGNVGTYIFAQAWPPEAIGTYTPGTRINGGNLRACSCDSEADDLWETPLPGIWQCQGLARGHLAGDGDWVAMKTLWIRVA